MSEEIVYICDKCGERFSQDESKRRIFDGEAWTGCPNCGCIELEEAKRCKVCHEIVPEYELTSGVCKDCFNDAVSAWKSIIEYLQPWQREVLEDEYGNLDITEQ